MPGGLSVYVNTSLLPEVLYNCVLCVKMPGGLSVNTSLLPEGLYNCVLCVKMPGGLSVYVS